MIEEIYTAPLSRYSKTNSGMPVDEVEAWLKQFPQKRAENKPNGGIIRSIADTSHFFTTDMTKAGRKAARAKAQREHKQALKNLAKQEQLDAKEIQRQRAKWKAEAEIEEREKARKAAMAERVAKKQVKKPVTAKATKQKVAKVSKPSSHDEARARRKAITDDLNAGKFIPMVSQDKEQGLFQPYQQQHMDLAYIKRTEKLKIVRISNIKQSKSFFTIDEFKRHDMEPVSGLLVGDDRQLLIKAVSSGEMVTVDKITGGSKVGASAMTRLARKFGMNIHAVFNGPCITGWVLLNEQ